MTTEEAMEAAADGTQKPIIFHGTPPRAFQWPRQDAEATEQTQAEEELFRYRGIFAGSPYGT
jgi:hypothetical protein